MIAISTIFNAGNISAQNTPSNEIPICIEENLGGPNSETLIELRQQRLIKKGAFISSSKPEGTPKTWGIQLWNVSHAKFPQLLVLKAGDFFT